MLRDYWIKYRFSNQSYLGLLTKYQFKLVPEQLGCDTVKTMLLRYFTGSCFISYDAKLKSDKLSLKYYLRPKKVRGRNVFDRRKIAAADTPSTSNEEVEITPKRKRRLSFAKNLKNQILVDNPRFICKHCDLELETSNLFQIHVLWKHPLVCEYSDCEEDRETL